MNRQSNTAAQLIVMLGDFLVFNCILAVTVKWCRPVNDLPNSAVTIFYLVNNLSLLISQFFFFSVVLERKVSAGDIIRRVVRLTFLQFLLSLLFFQFVLQSTPLGWVELLIGTAFFLVLILIRLTERKIVKSFRRAGKNTRSVTFVGSDPELINVYNKIMANPTMGYRVLGYYADEELGSWTHSIQSVSSEMNMPEVSPAIVDTSIEPLRKLGKMSDLLDNLNNKENLVLGDELFVCISRRDKTIIKKISQMCDRQVIRFYYVPVSVESLGLNLKRELIDDIEVFTTYENPLQNVANRVIKRSFDIVFSLICLIPTVLIIPFIFIIIRIQSPGPLFFTQKRTGLDGKEFEMIKFRSMHVNAGADTIQATKNDPRKFPFGNFMRKTNIDELPQFFNVLRGDMSIVGPRPHMLAHTEMYSSLIDKYMVRHFVRPGVTGWAQVTGFRGETKELWQMEGRVKRDIWYIENWSIWLDLRIIWMTIKSIFIHDKNAY